MVKFSDLIGKRIVKTEITEYLVLFKCSDGVLYQMYHERDCCEDVHLEDVTEDWADYLNDAVVIDAYESTNRDLKGLNPFDESYTWTFYRLITDKGCVVFRWYGASNGYYSESVTFSESQKNTNYMS